ncbi:MAG: hypothetical protein DRJ55_05070 [Thermoprotei archaeon]|nr:hypothetical protein [Candidatus Verstraetearchaeota archaeon]RLE91924.1 MAG: hypothetical protein DRJ55_05070 [Thermoprotei archaeon]HDI47010.1 hypothetical protein [Candidatus Methanomethylicia archaeon]
MEISEKAVKALVEYALAHCHYNCPAERKAENCIMLVEMAKKLNLPPPPCVEEMGGFDREIFEQKVKELEKKYGKPIGEILKGFEREGTKTLEEEIDRIEGSFAVEVLSVLNTLEQQK